MKQLIKLLIDSHTDRETMHIQSIEKLFILILSTGIGLEFNFSVEHPTQIKYLFNFWHS